MIPMLDIRRSHGAAPIIGVMTMKELKYSFGLMLEQCNSYGTERLTVRVMKREEGKNHPLNVSGSIWGSAEDCVRDALVLEGYVSDSNAKFYLHEVCYRDVHSIDLRRVGFMQSMLTRIGKALTKAEAREPGDMFVAFAKAIGATWLCQPSGRTRVFRRTPTWSGTG
jgi:hypothetical protein